MSVTDKTDYNPMRVFAFEQLTIAAASLGFTAATTIPSGATGSPALVATVTVETAPVRYRADGGTPSATVGTLLNPGDVITVYGDHDIQAMRFFRTTGVSATLDCEYAR
jgi:hypothetical protein